MMWYPNDERGAEGTMFVSVVCCFEAFGGVFSGIKQTNKRDAGHSASSQALSK